jgi:hypothetical protein
MLLHGGSVHTSAALLGHVLGTLRLDAEHVRDASAPDPVAELADRLAAELALLEEQVRAADLAVLREQLHAAGAAGVDGGRGRSRLGMSDVADRLVELLAWLGTAAGTTPPDASGPGTVEG